MKRSLVISCLAMLAAACAQAPSTAPPPSEAGIGEPDADRGILVVYRELVTPYAYTVSVPVNGERVASLPNNADTYIRVPPGEHTFIAFGSRMSGVIQSSPDVAVPVASYSLVEIPSASGLAQLN